METKENKKNWILSGVILVLFMVTQYMLRTKMFIYSDDVVAQERMLTMNHQVYVYIGKWKMVYRSFRCIYGTVAV